MILSFTCPNNSLLSYICLPLKKKDFMLQRFLTAVSLIIAINFLSACSTKFDIAAPYKNITAVNALLDMGDTAHYVRIQKAFLDQNQSALVMAQVADSSFYSQLTVAIKRIDVSGSVVGIDSLYRVDLNVEGYQKQGGTFFTQPNYAYKFKTPLNPSYTYRLVIKNPLSGDMDSAQTAIIDTGAIQVFQFAIPSYKIQLFGSNPNQVFGFIGTIPNTVAMYEGIMRVHWVDSTNTSSVQQYADWDFSPVSGVQQLGSFSTSTPCIDFFYFLRDNMGAPATGVRRYLEGVDIFIYGGSADLYNYQQLGLTAGTGITGSDNEPVYTNIKGANVMGLFAARGMKADYDIDFDLATKDSFVTSSTIKTILSGVNVVGFTR